ncbi:MAG: superoxide dismutase [Ferruginibacter sp.]|nr:superoxide dismutase [Ferruginibacter sp.]
MKPTTRRNFIEKSAKAGVATLIALPAINALMAAGRNTTSPLAPDFKIFATGFDQQPLPYAYNALEPSIDAQTMDIHYNKHAAAYSKNLKEAAAAEKVDTTKPLEDVLSKISKYSVKMRNNGGGHYNHELYWKCMLPNANAKPAGKFLTAIEKDFGSFDEMKKQLTTAATTRFGSGWAWLVYNSDKKIVVSSTPNQDNPLMDISEVKGFPLFGLDVWEHAYYLKYQNRRADYVENFWKILNWNYVGERFNSL